MRYWKVCCRYGVPGSGARRFEEVMRMTAPQRFQEDRDLLHHLTTLTPPPLLMNNGKSLRYACSPEAHVLQDLLGSPPLHVAAILAQCDLSTCLGHRS